MCTGCVLAVIAALLVIGGVECNPSSAGKGQSADEVSRCLDDLSQKLLNTRTELSVKITDAMHELTVILQACKQQVATHNNRLAAIERTQTALQAELTTLKASLPAPGATPSAPQQASTAPSLAMKDVVRELNLRESKKANIVISGIKPSCSLLLIW